MDNATSGGDSCVPSLACAVNFVITTVTRAGRANQRRIALSVRSAAQGKRCVRNSAYETDDNNNDSSGGTKPRIDPAA